jgi:hypothetical protein
MTWTPPCPSNMGVPSMWLRFDATTLWHSDAAEWAPTTASIAAYLFSLRAALCPLCADFVVKVGN